MRSIKLHERPVTPASPQKLRRTPPGSRPGRRSKRRIAHPPESSRGTGTGRGAMASQFGVPDREAMVDWVEPYFPRIGTGRDVNTVMADGAR